MRNEDDSLVLQIADSGRGFDPQKDEGRGLGLVSIRERVALLNGQLTLQSFPGGGASISVRVPLHPVLNTAYPAWKSA